MSEPVAQPSVKRQSNWRIVFRQFRRNRMAVAAMFVLAFLFVVEVVARRLGNRDEQTLRRALQTWFA